jgi:hypothetical protein
MSDERGCWGEMLVLLRGVAPLQRVQRCNHLLEGRRGIRHVVGGKVSLEAAAREWSEKQRFGLEGGGAAAKLLAQQSHRATIAWRRAQLIAKSTACRLPGRQGGVVELMAVCSESSTGLDGARGYLGCHLPTVRPASATGELHQMRRQAPASYGEREHRDIRGRMS